ncbi:MAG: hypothetical protein HY043_00825 [Verrucomicrobia bacterium]|nr:hypothetical protein [Verrucomicrobiota bacterium]
MAFESSLLSFCPRIEATQDTLSASTSWLVRFLSLGLFLRRVTVDRSAQSVTIERRLCWFFFKSRSIEFRHIAAVTYGYEDIALSASFTSTHDSTDLFIVGVLLVNREEVSLFKFLGDGTFTNDGPLPDWWYWEEYLTDWSGTQEKESRLFAQLLSKVIGVPLAPSTLTPDET